MIKVCLVCGYREHVKTLENDTALSHGVCDSPYCLRAYATHSMKGMAEREIENMISECEKAKIYDKAMARLESYCHSDGLTRSIHKPSGHTGIYAGCFL